MTVLEDVLQFCNALNERRASYRLSVDRPEAIRVTLDVPREYWEIEFFSDGHVELERFVGQGVEENPSALEDALRHFDA
jgi:hypothetical protein